MKQTITVKRSGGLDDWGKPIVGESVEMNARVEEVTESIRNHQGKEVVAGHRVILDKLADIRYEDAIQYTNELGVTIERNPQKVEVKRMLNGKPMLTMVYL